MERPSVGEIIRGEDPNISIAVVKTIRSDRDDFVTKLRKEPDDKWYAVSTKEECQSFGLVCILHQEPQSGDTLRISCVYEHYVMADLIPHGGNYDLPREGQIIGGISGKPIFVQKADRGYFTKLKWMGYTEGWAAITSQKEIEIFGLVCFINQPPKPEERIRIIYRPFHPKGNFARAVVVKSE